ncbi:MAG TPA: type II toxin-antitoxin system VapC family toxin [Actinomycetota bacterium]
MILVDVNVLVYAFREDAEDHIDYRRWLRAATRGQEPFGVSDLVLSGFLRVVTNPRAFTSPTPMAAALSFADALRAQPTYVPATPGSRHWEIFSSLCRTSGVRGSLVADAYHAALAIESGSEWITTDRDYARFPGLRWRHPLSD